MLPNKIYQKITDFVGNKIINVKTNTPTESEDVTNKKYVDDKQIYSTELSKKNLIPFNFSWMTNSIDGKTISQIFDELFFKSDTPEFIEAELELVSYFSNINSNFVNIFEKTNVLKIIGKSTLNDRESIKSSTLVATLMDGTKQRTTITLNDYNFSFDKEYSDLSVEVVYNKFKKKNDKSGVAVEPKDNKELTVTYSIYNKNGRINISNNLGYPTILGKAFYASNTLAEITKLATELGTSNDVTNNAKLTPIKDIITHSVSISNNYYNNYVLFVINEEISDYLKINLYDNLGAVVGFSDTFLFNQMEESKVKVTGYKLYILNLKTTERMTTSKLTSY